MAFDRQERGVRFAFRHDILKRRMAAGQGGGYRHRASLLPLMGACAAVPILLVEARNVTTAWPSSLPSAACGGTAPEARTPRYGKNSMPDLFAPSRRRQRDRSTPFFPAGKILLSIELNGQSGALTLLPDAAGTGIQIHAGGLAAKSAFQQPARTAQARLVVSISQDVPLTEAGGRARRA